MNNRKKTIFDNWNVNSDNQPLIISGPCSAESESQILSIGKELKSLGVDVFRAGIWKPRTRPNSFEGVGSIGLPWLQLLKKEFGFKTAIEVANSKHVDQALNSEIDILWIGARTSVNPFSIQEIADSLKGVDVPIFVKNPINPDVDLWQGAIERIQGAGISKIAAVHRGFSTYDKSVYRNKPMWELPIELRQRMPLIPMICDPSHIGGRRGMIQEISQKAMDLNYDGLMIESHIDPDNAWSDSDQQITPTQLKTILEKLVLKFVEVDNLEVKNELKELRNQIDYIDTELINVLSQRMKVANHIGKYKSINNITILQPKRWKEVVKRTLELGATEDLSSGFISKVFSAIHQESINKQTAYKIDK
jgi:chorismate mutase